MGGRSTDMAESKTGSSKELMGKQPNILFFIGSYGVMVRDISWLLVIAICSAIVFVSMIVRHSTNALNAISAASTLLSIALSFIAIIKSMIDSADAIRVNTKMEAILQNMDNKILEVSKELDVHKENEEVLKKNMEKAIQLLSLLSKADDEETKQKVVAQLSNESAMEEIKDVCKYFTQYLN